MAVSRIANLALLRTSGTQTPDSAAIRHMRTDRESPVTAIIILKGHIILSRPK
jgi:hypothetical protein